MAGFVLAAAREPLIRNGANLEADDPAYWSAIAKFYPTLGPASQREVGLKLMKRLWLWSAWAQIADRAGHPRRALALVSRDYWDSGSLAALDPLAQRIRTIVPTRPFGPALYYPASVERQVEAASGAQAGTRMEEPETYLSMRALQALIDSGAPVGYYVSDAAIGAIGGSGAGNAPSAWIVVEGALLPADERSRLTAVAPVVDSAAALGRLPGQPLQLPPGLSGFGFYDQAGRLILVISNPSTAPDARPISGTITMAAAAFPTGARVATDLLNGDTLPVGFDGGRTSLAVALARWDTIAVAIAPS
jgi:hypothetical protein